MTCHSACLLWRPSSKTKVEVMLKALQISLKSMDQVAFIHLPVVCMQRVRVLIHYSSLHSAQ